MKFSIKDFFSKRDQIRRKLRIWSPLLKKSLMENFIFCAVITSGSNWKLGFSESPLDIVKGFLIQFSTVWKIWLLVEVTYLKTIYGEAKNMGLTGLRYINGVI